MIWLLSCLDVAGSVFVYCGLVVYIAVCGGCVIVGLRFAVAMWFVFILCFVLFGGGLELRLWACMFVIWLFLLSLNLVLAGLWVWGFALGLWLDGLLYNCTLNLGCLRMSFWMVCTCGGLCSG